MEEYNNNTNLILSLSRIEVCDMLLACLAAQEAANDGGEKWKRLHDKIRDQIRDQLKDNDQRNGWS